MTTTPNVALTNARIAARLSQDDLATLVGTSKRQVQRWESGMTAVPRPRLARALVATLKVPIEQLGFAVQDGRGGYDVHASTPGQAAAPLAQGSGGYTGIWLSRYEYPSSGRGATFTGLHYVTITQHGADLDVRSIEGASSNPDSPLTMALVVEGSVVGGTWREQTAHDGYYKGAVYFGSVQFRVDPTGRRMQGKWVGFGRDGEVNTGPWDLIFQERSVAKSAVTRYARPPDQTAA